MDEARRLHYLAAMGITVWRPRDDIAVAEAPAPAAPAASDESLHRDQAPPPRLGSPRPSAAASAEHETAPANQEPAHAIAPTPMPPAQRPASPRPAAEPPQSAPSPPAAAPPPELDEPPPWSDDDLAGLPTDDGPMMPHDLFPPPPAAPPPPNPVADMGWPALKEAVAACRACGLSRRRTNTVFGVGDENAQLMFIGEGPGQDEDRQGEPFVGPAGQVLNRMLAAVDLKREQVYIANIVKCRPPNNRNPNPDEAAACRAFLERQIALIRPKLIVSLGAISANNLLGNTELVGRLRGRGHHYQPPDGSSPIPLLVTYHPSYYLRSPAEKAKGWQDLQRMIQMLRELG